MKLTKCEKNHFYDADKFATCPHCKKLETSNEPSLTGKQPTVVETTPKEVSHISRVGSVQPEYRQNSGYRGETRTEALMDGVRRGTTLTGTVDHSANNTGEAQDDAVIDSVAAVAAPPKPLLETVNAIKATIPYGAAKSDGESKTVAFYDNEVEPVIGWLVCVKGEYLGIGFPLKTGRNMIGRSATMDIALVKDISISRNCHTIITYEPQKQLFYVQPGEANGLTYVNEELLMLPQQICDYDKIQIGNSLFILRSLCGEGFSWEAYM